MADEALLVPAYTAANEALLVPAYERTPSATTTIIHDVAGGNIDAGATTLTDASTNTPSVTIVVNQSLDDFGWRHITFGANNLSGKTLTVTLDRLDKDGRADINTTTYKLVYTVDYVTWVQADSMAFNGGINGTIVATFNSLPSGTIYFSTNVHMRVADGITMAADLLANHSSVVSPTTSADSSGVYATTAAINNHYGTPAGGHDQYALTLDWGGATNDGAPKRDLVILAGIHAAGEGQSTILFREMVYWMLNDSGADAIAIRANWRVHIYFFLNPNGMQGGQHRYTLASSVDPNRSWNPSGSSSMSIIDDIQTALQADLPNGCDLLWSTHGDVYTTASFQMWVAPEERNVPRSAAMQEMIDQGTTIFGAAPDLNNASTRNTDVSWAIDVLGAKTSMDTETAAAAGTTVAYFNDLAVKWFQTLVAADAQGVFADALSITPSLYVNPNTFYTHTATVGGVQNLTPSLYVNTNTFYAHTLTVGNGAQNISPSLYVSQNTFYTHTLTNGVGDQTLTASLYVNPNVFWGATVSGGVVQPTVASTSGLTMLYDNYITSATLTATSTGTGFDVNNLKNNDKGQIWRSVNLSDQVITASLSSVKPISGVAVAFSNMIQGSSYRVRVYATSGSSTPIYDSGFLTISYSPDPPIGFSTIGFSSFPYGGGNYLSHTFEENQGGKVDITFRSPGNPDGAIEVSTIVISQSFQLIRGASYGANVSFVDDSDRVITDSGSTIVDIKPVKKEINFEVKHSPKADRLNLESVYRRAGSRMPVFCSLMETNSDAQDKEHFQIFGYLDQDGLTRSSYNLDSTSIKLTEI